MIGREAREQMLEAEGRLPGRGRSRASAAARTRSGIFAGFLDDADVRLVGVEAAGAASLGTGRPGVLHGARSSLLADEDGQIADAHSISAGLDYPGVGPEHAYLRDTGRVEYLAATDEEALAAFRRLAETEGIIPALEPAHALARARELDGELILVCLSGRGDKDLDEVLALRRREEDARRSTSWPGRRRRSSPRPPSSGGADLVEIGFPVLRPARRRPGDPPRGRAGARRRACARERASSASRETRARVDVPLVPMTYASLLEAYG